jgi:hypothetical protein
MEQPTSAFPVNSAILVFEQGTPELTRVLRVDDIVGLLHDEIEDLRKITKYGVDNSQFCDFSELLDNGISRETIQSVAHVIRSGFFKALSDRNLDLDSL